MCTLRIASAPNLSTHSPRTPIWNNQDVEMTLCTLQGTKVGLHLLPFCTASVSQLCTSCFSTLKAGPAAGSTPIDPAPSISASASHLSMAATAKLYSRS